MEDKDMSKPLIDKVKEGVASDADATRSEQDEHDHHHHHEHHDHQDSHDEKDGHGSHESHSAYGRRNRHHKHRHHRRWRRKLNINSKTGWLILSGVCVLFVALMVILQMRGTADSDTPTFGATVEGNLVVEMTNSEGVLVKSAIQKYLLMDMLDVSSENLGISSLGSGEGRLDAEVPVSLKVSVDTGTAILYKIELADNSSFTNAKVDYIEDSHGKYDFEHLCTNTTYYYRVTVYMKEGTEVATGQFKTADTPRILSIDGLMNVRDIGNWKTDSGKRIKQGLLIRGSEMDGAIEGDYILSNEGMMDMLEVLGIKTDMDLRVETSSCKDALGARVVHKYYGIQQYGLSFSDYGKERVRAVFSDLADPDNYPIYVHCTCGVDRTGTVCYLLEALLGVSRNDCLRDYGLSYRVSMDEFQYFEEKLRSYGGATLKEQAEAYLLSCGVSEYQIDSIRNIFLGE